MKSTIRDQFRESGPDTEEILELTPEMQVTPPDQPAKPEDPPPAAKIPAHATVMTRYLRGPYLRQLFGVAEVASLPFELEDPQYLCSNLQAVSRELNKTCKLIDMLYVKLSSLKPEGAETGQQADREFCQECIKAEREIRDRLLSVEAGLEDVLRDDALPAGQAVSTRALPARACRAPIPSARRLSGVYRSRGRTAAAAATVAAGDNASQRASVGGTESVASPRPPDDARVQSRR